MSGPPDIALTVLAGFLGAGKTTLLNHLLRARRPDGERVMVMVNDFGAINIDAALLAPNLREAGKVAGQGGIISLANGCVCCAIGGDLMQAFLKVLSLPEPPQRVVIEVSGVSDPARIAQLGRAGGGFRHDGVVTVVDAQAVRALAADRYVGDTVRAQLRAADLLLLNKIDLIDAAGRDALQAWLATQAPQARQLACSHGAVDPALIFGPDLGVAGGWPMRVQAGSTAAQGPVAEHAAVFASSSFRSSVRFDRDALEHALDTLPEQVLRAKGMVWLDREAAPRLLQICGKRWVLEPPGAPEVGAGSRIVFISARVPGRPVFDPWRHFCGALTG